MGVHAKGLVPHLVAGPGTALPRMSRTSVRRRSIGFLQHHSLSLSTASLLLLWVLLYSHTGPATHWGSFFGNAIADWTGVLVMVVATKYFYEIGSAESRQPRGRLRSRLREAFRNHSLTIVLAASGIGWVALYLRLDPEAKWGQVAGNIVSEWTQLLGLVLMTKRLMERKSKESSERPARAR